MGNKTLLLFLLSSALVTLAQQSTVPAEALKPEEPHEVRQSAHARRQSRGLFDFMGLLSKQLFGTAMADDVTALGCKEKSMPPQSSCASERFPIHPCSPPPFTPNAPDLLLPLSPIPPTPRSDPLSLTTLSPCSQPSTPPSLMPLCNE
ncbi:hypothetical protein Pcinc_002651 [Petrolisthes cinctipes]|uniref:Uncharacterized protein n=1 Tax=Petrolisthes cinctipes TaxID=88211 RepID=A0AAE1L208_PETCI|nr:hypothetical protein Pcinc_002651 [Petrolisthes cinctipes]